MEVGAVKQGFNNEVIHLKKNFIQARTHVVHKLTRKAKSFAEKKGPEKVTEKFKRKAEAAVKEVLIIKKLKPKDLAKFAITHKGNLNDFIIKPDVDHYKACARLLLHKSLQEKYKLFRTRFLGIPIKDLFMTREERRKQKKEAREMQKNKKKDKNKSNKVVNAEGEWNIEDVDVTAKESVNNKDNSDSGEEKSDVEEEDDQSMSNDASDNDVQMSDEELNHSDYVADEEHEDTTAAVDSDNESDNNHSDSSEEEDDKKNDADTFVKPISKKEQMKKVVSKNATIKPNLITLAKDEKQDNNKKLKNKAKQSKNKNLNEKLLSRKFKKDSEDSPVQVTSKIVDPFFITSTGENYMSVVEPRAPDEVKEVHRQGNRKLRRAAMFGHVPKVKPRQDRFDAEDRFNKQDRNERFDKQDRNDRFNKQNTFDRNNASNKFNSNNDFNNDKRNFTDKRNKFNSKQQDDPKPEKLHPSWEAKKRQSGILPFQGKKIVFNES